MKNREGVPGNNFCKCSAKLILKPTTNREMSSSVLTTGSGECWKPGLVGGAKPLALHPGLKPKGWYISPGRGETCETTDGGAA